MLDAAEFIFMKPTCSSAPRLPAQSGCCSRGWWFAPFLCASGHRSSRWLCWWCGCQWAWRPAVWWCSECRLWWMTALCSVEQKETMLRLRPLLSFNGEKILSYSSLTLSRWHCVILTENGTSGLLHTRHGSLSKKNPSNSTNPDSVLKKKKTIVTSLSWMSTTL